MRTRDNRTTRRQFAAHALAGAPLPALMRMGASSARASSSAPPAEAGLVHYQGGIPSGQLMALDDTRLLATVSDEGIRSRLAIASGSRPELAPLGITGPAGMISTDAARTWGAPFPYMQGGKPLAGVYCK